MHIGIIGSGNVGQTLAQRWIAKGHHIIFGSRDPASAKMAELLAVLGPAATGVALQKLEPQAEVFVLAVPWEAALESVQAIGDFNNKVLIDATNPITMTPEGLQTGLLLGHTTSAAEQIAESAVNARVVKAFNQSGAGVMANSAIDATQCTLFICGDDDPAKQITTQLAQDMSLRVLDAGNLQQARLLEPLGMLWIHLCYLQGKGPNFCFNVSELE